MTGRVEYYTFREGPLGEDAIDDCRKTLLDYLQAATRSEGERDRRVYPAKVSPFVETEHTVGVIFTAKPSTGIQRAQVAKWLVDHPAPAPLSDDDEVSFERFQKRAPPARQPPAQIVEESPPPVVHPPASEPEPSPEPPEPGEDILGRAVPARTTIPDFVVLPQIHRLAKPLRGVIRHEYVSPIDSVRARKIGRRGFWIVPIFWPQRRWGEWPHERCSGPSWSVEGDATSTLNWTEARLRRFWFVVDRLGHNGKSGSLLGHTVLITDVDVGSRGRGYGDHVRIWGDAALALDVRGLLDQVAVESEGSFWFVGRRLTWCDEKGERMFVA